MPTLSAVLLLQQMNLGSWIPIAWPTSSSPQELLSLLELVQPGCLPQRQVQMSGALPSRIRPLRGNCSLNPLQALRICSWVVTQRLSQILSSILQLHKTRRCSLLHFRNRVQLATWDSHRVRLWHFWHKPQQILFLKTCRTKKQLVRL